jgi:hypothetical protein
MTDEIVSHEAGGPGSTEPGSAAYGDDRGTGTVPVGIGDGAGERPPSRPPGALVIGSADDEADQPCLPVVVEEDGDPEGLGRALWALVQRDGVGRALSALEEGRVWHRVDPQCAGASAPGIVGVAGYGLRRVEPPGAVLAEAEAGEIAEGTWWYAMERRGMSVERQLAGHRRHVGFVAFEGPEPSWRDLLLAGAS